MTCVEGFVIPVPTANKDAFAAHARKVAEGFIGLGATRFVESWGDDVPDGKINDLKKAVNATADETIAFAWMEFPDKAARDAAVERSTTDPALADLRSTPPPFDGARMIVASFEPILAAGGGTSAGYVDGFVAPVPEANRDAYLAMAEKAARVFQEYGALRVVETWGGAIPDGKVTDYNRATLRKDGERVVFSWIEWPSKEARDAAWPKLMADERMQPRGDMPFDGKRMMWGGFAPLVDLAA